MTSQNRVARRRSSLQRRADFAVTLQAAKAGEEAAWAALANQFWNPIRSFALRQGATDPEGTANETFGLAYRSLGSFRGTTLPEFRAYLYQIARNQVRQEARRSQHRTRSFPVGDTSSIGEISGKINEFEDGVVGDASVQSMLALLNPDQRDVIQLRLLEDLSVEATAERLGKPPATVRVIQHRALLVLRAAMLALVAAFAVGAVIWLVDRTFPIDTVDDRERQDQNVDQETPDDAEEGRGELELLMNREDQLDGTPLPDALAPEIGAVSKPGAVGGAIPPTDRAAPSPTTSPTLPATAIPGEPPPTTVTVPTATPAPVAAPGPAPTTIPTTTISPAPTTTTLPPQPTTTAAPTPAPTTTMDPPAGLTPQELEDQFARIGEDFQAHADALDAAIDQMAEDFPDVLGAPVTPQVPALPQLPAFPAIPQLP